jgi:putative photosynthetic complex assembly protein 2
MPEHALPALLTTLFTWWFSTGLILYLDGLGRATHRWTMAGATLLLVVALWGLWLSAVDTSVGGAYHAFLAGLMVWAWQEVAFLLGFITGPNRAACPPGVSGLARAGQALRAILWHEIALVAGALVVLALTWGQANQVGLFTYMVLWVMRVSAKLNLHMGVRNHYDEFLPHHLHHLKQYFTRRPMNALFPFSVVLATLGCVVLFGRATAADASSFEMAGAALVGTLLALGVLEHWFLVLPIPAARLWQWGMASHQPLPAAVATSVVTAGPLPIPVNQVRLSWINAAGRVPHAKEEP